MDVKIDGVTESRLLPEMSEDDSRRRPKEAGDADLTASPDAASQHQMEAAPSDAAGTVSHDAGIRSMRIPLEGSAPSLPRADGPPVTAGS